MISTLGWNQITSQSEFDHVLSEFSMHDSLLKEYHVINRGYVNADYSMTMAHSFDGIFLFQTQSAPLSILFLLLDIENIHIDSPDEIYSGRGEIIPGIDDEKKISIIADGINITSKHLFHKMHPESFGPSAFLGSEIPSLKMYTARLDEDNWRQCGNCSNMWQVDPKIEIAVCPECLQLTAVNHDR